LKNSRIKKSERLTTVLLNVGAPQGIKKGMEFYLYAPPGLYASATVTDVNDTSSEAQIFQCCDDKAALPAVGWKLSTRSVRDSQHDERPR